MSRLSEIPVRMEGTPGAGGGLGGGGLGGGVSAILTELASLLERLAQSAVASAIDLRSLPMSPHDRSELQRALGRGEVVATLSGAGASTLQETGIPGVWWIEHRNDHGELIAELLEVAQVPQILASAPDEIAAAARTLRARIGEGALAAAGRN